MYECARCSEVFTSLSAFDKHQDVDYGRESASVVICLDPSQVGLELNSRGRWHFPMTEAGRARFERFKVPV